MLITWTPPLLLLLLLLLLLEKMSKQIFVNFTLKVINIITISQNGKIFHKYRCKTQEIQMSKKVNALATQDYNDSIYCIKKLKK